MAYTYDLSDGIGQVRFEIQDTTEATALFTDAEITYKLNENSGNVLRTASDLLRVLAAKFAGDVTFKTDDQQFNDSDRSKQYAAMADAIDARITGGIGSRTTKREDGFSTDKDTRDTASTSAAGRVIAGYTNPDIPVT